MQPHAATGVPEDDHLDWDDASVHPNSDNPRSPGAECTSGKTAILKGTINLRDIVAVNFSPKTTVPRQRVRVCMLTLWQHVHFYVAVYGPLVCVVNLLGHM